MSTRKPMAPEEVKGLISIEEGRWLRAQAALTRADSAIVEVGSYLGRSTAFLARGSLEGNRSLVYAVDVWTLHPSRVRYRNPKVLACFQSNMTACGVSHIVRPVQGRAKDMAQRLGEPIDLLFIDGDHSYDAVRSDFLTLSPRVAKGGLLAFHDYAPAETFGQGVVKFVDELTAAGGEWDPVQNCPGWIRAFRRT